jgi:hypothetical protein
MHAECYRALREGIYPWVLVGSSWMPPNNPLEATWDPDKSIQDERWAAICMCWGMFAKLESRSWNDPRRLSSRPLDGYINKSI